MSNFVFTLQNVHKKFKDKEVLRGVNLNIPQGSVVGLLGQNASGKSTLLKCGLGILKIQQGKIQILGENTWDASAEVKSRIGYVPQKIELYKWMTVRQILDYTAAFYSTWNEKLIQRLTKELRLNEDDKVGKLSGGQLQSVALLLALGHEPDLLILDEPAASLDPTMRRHFLSLVLDIVKDQNRTVIFSTHLTSDIERIADTVAILKGGKIFYFGGLDELKDEVKQIRISTSGVIPATLKIPGLLHVEQSGNDALLCVRGVTPDMLRQLENQLQGSIEIRDMNLEDIFVEVHRE